MSRELFQGLYDQAPRWFKVIKWKKNVVRQYNQSKRQWAVLGPGIALYLYFGTDDPCDFWITQIARQKPQTEQEVLDIKRDYKKNPYRRDWELGEYDYDHPPLYDLSRRRLQYPEYYGDRYSGYKKTGIAVAPPSYQYRAPSTPFDYKPPEK